MDAFYASIEQRDDPSLRGKPVIVGGMSGRGVVAAASYEARPFGVRSAMPAYRAKELCPHAIFVVPRMAHYAAVSAEVHAVFARFTPLIEPLAFDEAFLDITGSVRLFGGVRPLAERLKQEVFDATELSVSVGVGPNKLVAKIACALGKPNGLRLVEAADVRALLDPLPLRKLWGVGPVLGERLTQLGIKTFRELVDYDTKLLTSLIGARASELQALARGEDGRPVENDRTPRSVGEEATFEQDISDRRRIREILAAHADAVARRLRHQGYQGRTVTMKAKLGRARGTRTARGQNDGREPYYPLVTRSKTLPGATADGFTIASVAQELWDKAGIREPVRLLGVSVAALSQAAQLDLFAPAGEKLGPALDRINARFGAGAIGRALDAPAKITPGRTRKRGEPE